MAITDETRNQIIELVVAANNAAPSVVLLAEISMLAMDIEIAKEMVARTISIELTMPPNIDIKDMFAAEPIEKRHSMSSRKGKNRNRYWEGS